jgi:DNA-binding IclR family transcriptional regulator
VDQAQYPVAPKSVLERVFALLDCFTAEEPEHTLAELTSRTKIPKPTVHRLTSVLVRRRLLNRTGTGFVLGPRLSELGALAGEQRIMVDASPRVLLVGEQRTILDTSLPVLEELFKQTHETIHLGMLQRDEVPYGTKIVKYRAFPLPTRADGRWPLHACALGKAMLAFESPGRVRSLLQSELKALTPLTITDPNRLWLQLARARREGIAHERDEAVVGNACVAAPIFNWVGHPVAAVSVGGPPVRLRDEQWGSIVRRAGTDITSRIAGRVPDGWALAPVLRAQCMRR